MMARRRCIAAALCLALCAAAGAQAVRIASAADFLAANADEFQIMNALLKKSGLAGALASDLANTYFLPPDSAFLLDLGESAPELSLGNDPNMQPMTVAEILQKVDAMSTDDAVQFVKAHVVPASYPNVTALAFPNGRPTGTPDPKADPVTVTNSLNKKLEVIYDWGANNLHLSVPIGSDGDRTAAFVAGPAAFPVGKATVYVVHALMADPTLITGKKQR